eukprot:363219-Chlamydomonas_euryale.AAC.8
MIVGDGGHVCTVGALRHPRAGVPDCMRSTPATRAHGGSEGADQKQQARKTRGDRSCWHVQSIVVDLEAMGDLRNLGDARDPAEPTSPSDFQHAFAPGTYTMCVLTLPVKLAVNYVSQYGTTCVLTVLPTARPPRFSA